MPTGNLLPRRLSISCGRLVGSVMVPPRVGLERWGPTVQVSVGLHAHLKAALRQKGETPPQDINCVALIDSGATCTLIDSDIARQLQLQPSGRITSVGIGGEAQGVTVACSVNIHGLDINLARAHCQDLAKYSKGLSALIGRDILSHMVFHYDGLAGSFYLELPTPQPPPKSKTLGSKKGSKRRPRPRKRK